jgi:predicted DsbA family dithiol-disulfide isomerase
MRFLFRTAVVLILITTGSGLLPAQKASNTQEQKGSGSRPMATIDGVPITETQARMEGAAALDSLELQIMKSKAIASRNEHQILEKALERIIEEKLLRAEAEKQKISKEELLEKEVKKKVSEPTAEQVDAFYEENKQRIVKSKEEVAPDIRRYLKQREESKLREEFIDKLEKEHQVVRLLEPLRYNVNISERPTSGPVSAPVLLVLFSDFQCPYCKMFSGTIKQVQKQYGDKVHLVFRQFPLSEIHPNAKNAAEASLCAWAQGKFWEMHDLLFQDQNNLRAESLRDRADKIGLDVAAFNTCMDSGRYGSQIYEDLHAGAAVGVEGTPALFINGRFIYGAQPYENVVEIIDEELSAKQETNLNK